MKKKKEKIITAAAVIILIAGLAIMLYPTLSDLINNAEQSGYIATYREDVRGLDDEMYDRMLEDARAYNADMDYQKRTCSINETIRRRYMSLLDLSGLGIMGYVDVPAINQRLPIYHGTDDEVLAAGVGHLEWSSLPVGGEGTHCVLSGHTGLPSAYLFSDLDELEIGDRFTITVLDEILTYEIDRIITVLPEETEYMSIEEGKDYCTLMTCTPYGINTHRLLCRGVRVENEPSGMRISSDAEELSFLWSVVFVTVPILLAVIAVIAAKRFVKRKNSSETA